MIYCTGFTSRSTEFLNNSILKSLEYDPSVHYKHAMMLYKCTFHPDVPNLAMIGLQDGLFFNGAELQAKWASQVFSGKTKLPDKALMHQYIRKQVRKREEERRSQYPYGSQVSLCDSLAAEMDLLPDFDELQRTNSKLYKMFWNDSMFSAHFMYKEDRTLATILMNRMNLWNRHMFKLNEAELAKNNTHYVAKMYAQKFKYFLENTPVKVR